MSSSNSSFAEAVSNVQRNMVIFVQIWSIGLFAFGALGNALNIYVFTRLKFRFNPCVRYFLAMTLFGYAVICFNVPLRLLQINYNVDVFISSLGMCRFFSYILACFKVVPSWFIALASIDRFLCSSSSVTLRNWSNIRTASRVIPITILFIALAYIHMPFNYTIVLPQRTCTFVSSTYQGFYGLWNLIIWSWIPTICTLIFGFLIVRHIRQGRRRVVPQNRFQRNQRKTDRQLIQMLLIQSFIFGSTSTALSIGNLYISITNNLMVKNDLEEARDSFLTNALGYIALTGPCMSFYLFTLSSQLFRHELTNLFFWR